MNKRVRFFLLLLTLVVMGLLLYPTVNWYFMVPEDLQQITSGTREEIRRYAQDVAASDLRQILAADLADEVPAELEYIIPIARDLYRQLELDRPSVWTVEAVFTAFTSDDELVRSMEEYHRERVLSIKDQKNRIINLGLDLSGGINVVLEADVESLTEQLGRAPSDEELSEAIDLALEILNNRIDSFGVTEPVIRRQEGANRIEIEIPGDNDPERVNAFLQGSGSLRFQIVDEEATNALAEFRDTFRDENNRDWDPVVDENPEFILAGTEVRPLVQRDVYGIDETVFYYVTKEDSSNIMEGQYITDASVVADNVTGRPLTTFRLDTEGADIFQQLTAANVDVRLAIVMDGKVRAGAFIQEEIAGGAVSISGFSAEEADNIRRVLQTAALPIELVIVNQQRVGASLGADAVQAGVQAILLGLAAVVVFMIIYYKSAGIIATLGLIINLFIITSILSALGFTMTLTSIAGLILTVGMAVDANVIIFERIKEEYRLGKSSTASVAAGYQKAFWTIMDANLTTGIAAFLLSFLGTGPVQGFAVTLFVGIISSVFTALWVTRLFFDISTEGLGRQKLSITWRAS